MPRRVTLRRNCWLVHWLRFPTVFMALTSGFGGAAGNRTRPKNCRDLRKRGIWLRESTRNDAKRPADTREVLTASTRTVTGDLAVWDSHVAIVLAQRDVDRRVIKWDTAAPRSLHRLTPLRVPVEARRFRHVAAAIPEVGIGAGIAACSRR